jgi:CelD/BcsL family acetyltransferase involved in cellulose biosynthesis
MYSPGVTPTLQADPECARPGGRSVEGDRPGDIAPGDIAPGPLRAERRAFADVDPEVWDELVALNPYSTPFSTWAFHRAWWDAYGENAHDQTVVVVDPSSASPDRPVAIVPLMDRHAVEPSDAETHTTIRHGQTLPLTPITPSACVVYFGASYHADYATLLAHPRDLPRVAEALVQGLAHDAIRPEAPPDDPTHPEQWRAADLRRLRAADPATDALATAVNSHEMAEGWTLNVEREDVCPVIRLPEGGDLDAFIELHQARWGERGLFPANHGGDQSRVFVRRLFELFGERERDGFSVHLSFLEVDGRRIGAAIHFETPGSLLYYNAGIDPEARDLSPGVVLLERLVRGAIERGKCRVDLLRGDEAYKYEWGAVDEPVQRILVRRAVTATTAEPA